MRRSVTTRISGVESGGHFNVIGVDSTNNPAAGNVISGNLDYGVGIWGE